MTTTVVSKQTAEPSPQVEARAAGALWLACIVTGILGVIAASAVTVPNDAAATAANMVANGFRFRLGLTVDLLSGASYLGVTALLYYLLRPAGRSLSLLAGFFGLAGVAIGGFAWISDLTRLVLVSGDRVLAAFTTSQLQSMMMVAFRVRLQVFSVAMVFFGLQCVLLGTLIARSTFLPRALGVLLALGGSSYVVLSLANLLVPSVAGRLLLVVMPIALVGEGSLAVWLLAKGVDVQRWSECSRGGDQPPAANPSARAVVSPSR